MNTEAEIELTPIEYARLRNIAVDHRKFPPPLSDIKRLQNETATSLTSDEHLTSIQFSVPINTVECLDIEEYSALLVAEAEGIRHFNIESTISSLLDLRTAKKLHVDLPLLRTDHYEDIRAFATWEQVDGSLPHEPLECEMDQCLEWPTKLQNLSSQIIGELKTEKILCSKDLLLYLQGTVTDTWTEEDELLMWKSAVPDKSNFALEPLTPPLLPSTPTAEPYILSSPACHLPLLSDPPSLISDDLRDAEHSIFENDMLEPVARAKISDPSLSSSNEEDKFEGLSDIVSPFIRFSSDESLPNISRPKQDDFKVEVPLIPQYSLPISSPSKSVKFSDYIEEIMLLDSCSPNPLLSDAIMPDEMIAAAETIKRRSEQEQLQEADAKSRVEVPQMDFKLPYPPWKYLQDMNHDSTTVLTAQQEFLLRIKADFGFPALWRGAKRLNQVLSWVPFPAELGLVALDEKFGEEHDLDGLLFDTTPVNDSGSLTWKPPGLRVLKSEDDGYDDEDELQPGPFEEKHSNDITSLIRKRKMQFDEERLSIANNLSARKPLDESHSIGRTSTEHSSKNTFLNTENVSQEPSEHNSNFLLGGGLFSVGNAVENFLEIRASKKQKPVDSTYFGDKDRSGPDLGYKNRGEVAKTQQVELIQPAKVIQKILIAPPLNPVSRQQQCIISSTLLQHRTLIRILQSLLPILNLVERDFSAHNTTTWLPGSISRSPIRSSLADEADLIVSPSTSIILTTVTQIRQKPLPGQKTKVAIRERIEKASYRYEKLLIFVSEGYTSTWAGEVSDGIDEQGSAVLAEFAAFCASIKTSTLMYFVNGGEVNLAKWIASVISQDPPLEASLLAPLLAEETLWELFLRRAGMNAFAAQVVLAELKAPEGIDVVGSPSKAGIFGLAAFVEMGAPERARRFGRLLGGTRALEMVGRVVEMNWRA